MVHKAARTWGIRKFEPIKFMAFDFDEDEWQSIEVYPDPKVIVIKPAHAGEEEEIRKFDRIKDGLE